MRLHATAMPLPKSLSPEKSGILWDESLKIRENIPNFVLPNKKAKIRKQ